LVAQKNPQLDLQHAVTEALKAIDPEAAARAGIK
jgi:hypothetical protein